MKFIVLREIQEEKNLVLPFESRSFSAELTTS